MFLLVQWGCYLQLLNSLVKSPELAKFHQYYLFHILRWM
ncbi:hypothetical protein yfred0001_13080 [Yersinia frederiksenii ATCC 33641]|nr:hypothetical protein yfred0001_13080 [Yersinia frederiksenii ATCC 33641]